MLRVSRELHMEDPVFAAATVYLFYFARSLIEIASPTARRLRASTSTSASTSPASSSSPTLRHGEMAGTLGGARLRRRLHRRLVRTSTFAGSSSPSPTSPTVVSPHATRSDQPMCVIHPAPATSILIERALHRAWRAVAASPLQAAAAPPVVSLAVASSPPPTTSTTSSLTNRCASRAWSSSSCTGSSPSPSSTATAQSRSFGLVLENLGSPPCFV